MYQPNNPSFQSFQNTQPVQHPTPPAFYAEQPPVYNQDINKSAYNQPVYYNPAYSPQVYCQPVFPDKKQIEKTNVRKLCNKIGGALLMFIGINGVLSFLLQLILLFTAGLQGIQNFSIYFALNGVISVASVALPAIILSKMCHKSLDELISFKKVNIKQLLAFLFAGYTFVIGGNVLLQFFNANISLFGFENSVASYEGDYKLLDCILMVISISIIPPLVEEFLFRGVILGTLRKYGDGFAIIISALMFGLAHGNFVQTPVTFVTGLILGYMTIHFKSIIPAILLHFFNNFYVSVLTIFENYISQNIYILINSVAMITFFVLGFILMVSVTRKDKDIIKIKKSNSIIPLKSKIICALTAPCTIIFVIIQLLNSIIIGVYSQWMT